jgi:hypothetical protein
MDLSVRFVGVIRDGGVNSRVLTQAADGLFYVWRTSSRDVQGLRSAGMFSVSGDELELASEQQVLVGRDTSGKVSVGSLEVEYHGLVRRGKTNLRVLVTEPGGSQYFTAVIPVGELPEPGAVFEVSRHCVSDAREDQIEAGLGVGKLRRVSRKDRVSGD